MLTAFACYYLLEQQNLRIAFLGRCVEDMRGALRSTRIGARGISPLQTL